MPPDSSPVLLTGATGFLGGHLLPALRALGYPVRCASRNPPGNGGPGDGCTWVEVDLETGEGLDAALEGCDSAFYLYHAMAEGEGYHERERAAAKGFRRAAEDAGLRRVVYMGGVEPEGEPSKHLASRLETGRILRDGPVSTIELRAAMIIGEGSASWTIVRDLSSRLPAMALPSWLRNRSMPVLVDDLVVALVQALRRETTGSEVFDVPGANAISHRDLLKLVARKLGHDPPMVDVPGVFPELSSLWVGLFSDADLRVARELVDGLRTDLLPTQPVVWDHVKGGPPATVEEAVDRVLRDHEADSLPAPSAMGRIVSRVQALHAQ